MHTTFISYLSYTTYFRQNVSYTNVIIVVIYRNIFHYIDKVSDITHYLEYDQILSVFESTSKIFSLLTEIMESAEKLWLNSLSKSGVQPLDGKGKKGI